MSDSVTAQPGGRIRRPYLIVIRNGPIWKLDGLVALAETLAGGFSGEIWTYSDAAAERVVGSFRIRRDRVPPPFGAISRGLRSVRLVGRLLFLRWMRGRRLVVVTYDPLASGIIGVLAKLLTGAGFVCEVNGVYGDPNNLIDLADQEAADAKRQRMLRFGSRVLAWADHIKLLFPEQLVGFSVPASTPRSVFFDFVDTSRFRYAEVDQQERLVLFVGHPLLRKGVDVLLTAFARVRAEHPEWRLVLIGYRIAEEVAARDLPTDGVEIFGPLPQDEIDRWMERCQALILPSRSEAMGRVLIEAALKGRPRLGSRVGGIPTYVAHEEDGLLFAPDDVDDLAATLERFIGDPDAAGRMGSTARARAERDFSRDQYLRLYEELISQL